MGQAQLTITLDENALAKLRQRAAAQHVDVATLAGDLLSEQLESNESQAWFWTKEWQAEEREADEDIKAGRVTQYDSAEEFIKSLERDLNDV